MIDWKPFIASLVEKGFIALLTVIATKWSDAAVVVHRLLIGDTVPLYDGAINLNLSQIQLWVTTGIIALISGILGYYRKQKAKRNLNIALQLPKGATKTDVAAVADQSPAFSALPNFQAIRTVSNNLASR